MTDGRADELRASDADRDRVANLLREHCTEGRITLDELSERLGEVYAARTHRELYAVTRDLPVPAVRPPPAPAPRPRPVSHLRAAFASWACLAVVLVAIWALSGFGYFWPQWPLGIWAALILAGALKQWIGGENPTD